jgi:hypothetical protein
MVPRECFSGDVITRRSAEHGFAQPNTLEALLWDYEIYAQLQERVKGAARLKGGAATQLYVSPDRQRASVDIDVLTSLPKEAIEAQLSEIGKALESDGHYFLFEPYVPSNPSKTPGLHSHTVLVPSALGQMWRLQDGREIEGRMIKIDFHEVAGLPPEHSRAAVVAGINLQFEALCVSSGYLIAEKLLTQARNTVGVPDSRYQDLPKHLYDLDGLTSVETAGLSLTEAAQWLPETIDQQGPEWRGRAQLARVLEDLEMSLAGFAVIDYIEDRERFGRAVQRLETLYLPAACRWRLHQRATKAARVLALVRVMRRAILDGVGLQPDLLRALEALATKARTHAEPARLAQALFSRLPPELRGIRQLKGSPPERLFWILAARDNLDWLTETLT